MISLSVYLLFVCRKFTNIYELILHSAALVKKFCSFSLCVEVLESFMYESHENKDTSTSFLPVDYLDLYYLIFINFPMTISSIKFLWIQRNHSKGFFSCLILHCVLRKLTEKLTIKGYYITNIFYSFTKVSQKTNLRR